jgi:hypothetical protein
MEQAPGEGVVNGTGGHVEGTACSGVSHLFIFLVLIDFVHTGINSVDCRKWIAYSNYSYQASSKGVQMMMIPPFQRL